MTSTPVTGESSRTAGVNNKNTYKSRQGEKENFNNILGNVSAQTSYKPPIQQNKASEIGKNDKGSKVDHVSPKDTSAKESGANDKNIAIKNPQTSDKNTAIKDPQQDSTKEINNDVGKADLSSETEDITVKDDVLTKEMQTLLGKIQQEIADQLGISLEELMSIMQSMGMGITDLLNQSDVSKLAARVLGDGDMLSFATNEELYGRLTDMIKEVQALIDGFQQEFNVSDEELAQLLKNAEEANQKLISEANQEESAADHKNQTITNGMETDQTQEEPMVQVKVSNTQSNKEVIQAEDTQTEETITTTDNEEALKGVTKQQQDGASGDKGADKDSDSNPVFANQMQSQNTQGGVNVLDELLKQSGLSKEVADTGEVIKQILDYMKIHINGEATEMEMQLHPASLGSIHLQVALKAGAITAQFSAQNEAVKAALESQIVQLKENLEAQGLKIEAVEVTIASHEFERNLEQDNKGEQSKESKSKSRKQIRLDENFDYEGSGLEEEQRMEVDMMTRNGNTVDFSA